MARITRTQVSDARGASRLLVVGGDGTCGVAVVVGPEVMLRAMTVYYRPIANEVEGYYSAVACFMANQAYRTKSRVVWNSKWEI
mgnify:CR=1 FL=1